MDNVVSICGGEVQEVKEQSLAKQVASAILMGHSIHNGSWSESRFLDLLDEDGDPDTHTCYEVSIQKATREAAKIVGIPELSGFLALVNSKCDLETWAIQTLFPTTEEIYPRLSKSIEEREEEGVSQFSVKDFCNICDPGCLNEETGKIHGAIDPYCWATQLGDVITTGPAFDGLDVEVGQFWVRIIRAS